MIIVHNERKREKDSEIAMCMFAVS